ncbi:MAG TPA: enoyl-CoA hydratase-related protein [Pseudolabrys sp.]|nr:enoyl-CoA hydratase-related protein [Pseudolabrys sp.]
MTTSDLSVERPAPGVALIRYSRPKTLNALDVEMRRRLADQLVALGEDETVRVAVLAGTDKAFAAGADLSEMAKADSVTVHGWNTGQSWKQIAAFPKPLIAAVKGFALGGGCELAMHCDIIIAGESARFGQPEVKVGIMPGAGGTQRLTRAVGKFRANLYLMTGRLFSAQTALEMGLVSEVVADADVETTALTLAGEIAALPPLALKFIKESVALADNAPLEAGLEYERRSFQFLFSTADQKEGMAAFLEKRKPTYQGR